MHDLEAKVRLLNSVGTSIASKININDVFITIVKESQEITNAEEITLFVYDKVSNELVVRAQKSAGEGPGRIVDLKANNSLVGEVFKSGNTLRMSEEAIKVTTGYLAKSLLCVPMITKKNKIGMLCAFNWRKHEDFSEQDESLLSVIANYAAIALENSKLYEKSNERANALSCLHHVSQSMLSLRTDSRQLLKIIADCALQVLSGDLVVIFEYLSNADRIVTPPIVTGKDIRHLDLLEKKRTEDLNQGLLSNLLNRETPFYASNGPRDWKESKFYTEDPVLRQDGFFTREGVVSSVGVPLRIDGEVLGLMFINYRSRKVFTEEVREITEIFTNHAALAIKNSRVFQEKQNYLDQLSTLNEIVQKISTKLDKDELLNEIVKQIKTRLRCTHCTLYFYKRREDGEFLVPSVVYGEKIDKSNILRREFRLNLKEKSSDGLVGFAYEEGRPMVFSNAALHPRFSAATKYPEFHKRSMLIVPVLTGGYIKGMICADQDDINWFSENDMNWVSGLAYHVGIAIERTVSLKILHDIENKLIRSIGMESIGSILSQIIQGALELTDMEAGIIYLFESDLETIKIEHKYPRDAFMPPPRRDKDGKLIGLTKQIIITRSIISISEPEKDIRASRTLIDNRQSLIGLPLLIGENVIGAMFLVDTRMHTCTDIEQSILSALSNQASQVIYTANLIEQQHAVQINAIREITNSIPARFEIKRVLKKILSWTLTLMDHATLAALEIVDDTTNSPLPLIVVGEPVDPIYKQNLRRRGGLVDWVVKNKRSVNVGDTKNDQRYLPLRDDVNSELVIPLIRGEKVLGVLNIEHSSYSAFTETHKELAETIAGFVLVAYENSQLYKELNHQVDELEKAQIEIAERERGLVLSSISADFIHRLGNLVGTIPKWAQMAKRENEKAGTQANGKIVRYLDRIIAETNVVFEEANKLRSPIPDPEVIDIRELVESLVAQMEYLYPPEITLIEHYEDNLGKIFAVRRLIEDALYNILDNARKSLSGKGEIDIAVYRDPKDPEGFGTIEIIDDGIGIPGNEDIFRLGTSFWKDEVGFGYGLWRAENIIKSIGGTIRATRRPERGSVFSISLPFYFD